MGHVSAPDPTSEAGVVYSLRTRVSARPLLSDVAGSGAEGHMVESYPSWTVRRGLEPLGTWQRRSPTR
jgi:hypothetical protein